MSEDLASWWNRVSDQELQELLPKAAEYGSNSLEQLGHKMAALRGKKVTDAEALELGCWVYALGKMERWTDAVLRGDRPSNDTLKDLGVYVRMAQRIRDVNDWPGKVIVDETLWELQEISDESAARVQKIKNGAHQHEENNR